MKLVQSRYPDAVFTVYMVREWKEKFSFVGNPPGPVIVQAPIRGVPTDLDITFEMRTACESLIAPSVETMIDLISKVEPEFQEKVRNNVILSGGGGLIPGLAQALKKGLDQIGGGSVRSLEDPVFIGSDGGLLLAQDAPDSDWEKLTA
jgi:rod shape-determining protein MreB